MKLLINSCVFTYWVDWKLVHTPVTVKVCTFRCLVVDPSSELSRLSGLTSFSYLLRSSFRKTRLLPLNYFVHHIISKPLFDSCTISVPSSSSSLFGKSLTFHLPFPLLIYSFSTKFILIWFSTIHQKLWIWCRRLSEPISYLMFIIVGTFRYFPFVSTVLILHLPPSSPPPFLPSWLLEENVSPQLTDGRGTFVVVLLDR